jgi:hypothetical protein
VITIDPAKFIDLFELRNASVTKTTAYNLESDVNPDGTLCVAISSIDVANQGLPDYWVGVSVNGMTLAERDPNGDVLREMHADAFETVNRFTPAQLTEALGFAPYCAVLGIIDITSHFSSDGHVHTFRIDFRMATSGNYLFYTEKPLPEYEIADGESGVIYMRFVNTSPCAVQRLVTVRTTAEDGGARSVTTREAAYGEWDERETLTYYPINQPIPVTQ